MKDSGYRHLSIKRKLELLVLLISSTAIMLVCAVFITYERSQYNQRAMSDLRALAEIIGDNCASAFSFNDPVDAWEVLQSLKAKRPIEYASLYRHDGSLLAEYHRDVNVSPAPCASCLDDAKCGLADKRLIMRREVYLNDSFLGTVFIQSDSSELTAFLAKSIAMTALVFLLSVVIVFLLARKLQGIISIPIYALVDTAQRVSAADDYSLRARKHHDDEVGALADAFNNMLSKVERRNRDLGQLRNYLKNIIDSMPSIIIGINAEDKVTQWNAEAEKVAGLPAHEAMGRVLAEVFPQLSDQMDSVREAIATGTIKSNEKTTRQKGGEILVHDITVYPLITDGAKGAVIRIDDATERVRVARELQLSHEKHQRLVNNLRDSFLYRQGTDGVFNYVSSSVTQVLGYPTEEYLSHFTSHLTDHPINKAAIKHMARSLAGGPQPPYELEVYHKDGSKRWLSVSETPVLDDAGNVTAVEGIAHDLTERKKVTTELRQYGHILSRSNDMTALIDRDFRYLAANDVYAAAFGMVTDELLGRTVADILGTRFFETVMRPHAEACMAGKNVRYGDWIDFPAQGRRYMDVAYSPYVGSDGTTHGFGVIARDVTDMKEAQQREKDLREQLARSERMKALGVLAGGVAHDLNNVLGPIVTLPELIEEDLDDAIQGKAKSKELIISELDAIKSSAQRAAVVVRDLVALGRRGRYDLVALDLNSLPCIAGDSPDIRNLKASNPAVRIQYRATKDKLPVLASEDHVARAVHNLVRNAAEAIDEEGEVTLTTSKRHLATERAGYTVVPAGDYAVIEVSDNGQGILPKHLNRLFEPFFTKKKKKTASSGSGLGLSVVHGIIEDHGGFVNVTSEVGKGTTFTVYLPLTTTPLAAAETVDKQPLPAGCENLLVVDDEPGQRYLVRKSMGKRGYTVSEAENGSSAVALFKKAHQAQLESPYDLVILDMVMEDGFDGLDALNQIRSLYPEQRIMIASGHAENARVTAARDLGAGWLSKPYDVGTLVRAVRASLDD